MFYRYRLFNEDGSEAGEAHYAVLIQPGEDIWTGDGGHLRVVDIVPVHEDDSPYVGFLNESRAQSCAAPHERTGARPGRHLAYQAGSGARGRRTETAQTRVAECGKYDTQNEDSLALSQRCVDADEPPCARVLERSIAYWCSS
jgi:hypothetical protein